MRVLISDKAYEGIEKDYEQAARLCLESEGIEPENVEISVAFMSNGAEIGRASCRERV